MRGNLVTLAALAAGIPAFCPAVEPPPATTPVVSECPVLAGLPVEVQRYILKVTAENARAGADAVEMGIDPASRQALVLVSGLRVLNEVPVDTLPAGYQSYIQGLRGIRNDLVPRMSAAFLAVAADPEAEEGLTGVLAPLEEELQRREAELDAAHPEAAKALGRQSMTDVGVALAQRLVPQQGAQGGRKGMAARQRRLAVEIEKLLQQP